MLDAGVSLPPSAFEAWFLTAAHDDEALSQVLVALPAAARAAARAIPEAIMRFPADDRAAWLVRRQSDVTASTIGALLGAHEFLTRYQLWCLKGDLLTEDPTETAPMLQTQNV